MLSARPGSAPAYPRPRDADQTPTQQGPQASGWGFVAETCSRGLSNRRIGYPANSIIRRRSHERPAHSPEWREFVQPEREDAERTAGADRTPTTKEAALADAVDLDAPAVAERREGDGRAGTFIQQGEGRIP